MAIFSAMPILSLGVVVCTIVFSCSAAYRTPVVSGQQLIIENWAVCIGLNPTCAESLSLFTLEMSFKSDGVDMVVTGQARGCGSNGFKFSIQEYEDTISLATVVIKFNTMEIERITNLSLVERAPSGMYHNVL